MNDEAPKYRQIVETVIRDIKLENLKSGDMLASERELMIRWNVSRTTAVRALDELALRGIVERKQGIGTFVRRGAVSLWEADEVKRILDALADYEPDVTQQIDKIIIQIPGKPDQIEIEEPSDRIPTLADWPYLVSYSWPEVAEFGDTMDLAVFQQPEDVVNYVLGILDHGGYSYKVSEN